MLGFCGRVQNMFDQNVNMREYVSIFHNRQGYKYVSYYT